MIRAALVMCAAVLSGCAGQAAYSVKPFYEPNLKTMVCCEAIALNSKDIATLQFDLSIAPAGTVTAHFTETGVGATQPIQANSAAVSAVAGAVSNAAAAAVKLVP